TVALGNSVTNIGDGAFYDCASLAAINVAPLNVFYSSMEGVLFDKNSKMLIQFPMGKGGSYTLPDGVTIIGNFAFYYCAGLTSVTIGNSITGIGVFAFANCTSLANVTIPDSVTSFGNGVFFNCTGLTDAIIGNSVTSIESSVFYNCTNLTSVTIGNSVTNIGR